MALVTAGCLAALFCTAFAGGCVNALAGGGSLLTFPMLVESSGKLLVQFVTQGNWKREHLRWLNKLLIQAFPYLFNSKCWLTF